MGLPDKQGRGVLFGKLLSKMSTCANIHIDTLADMTEGFSGAQIEHATNEAGLLAVKEAIKNQSPTETVSISQEHLLQAIHQIKQRLPSISNPKIIQQPTAAILSPLESFSQHLM